MAGALEDPSVRVQEEALRWLTKRHANNERLAKQVADSLRDDVPQRRSSAAAALGEMGPAASALAPRVAALLRDPDSKVRSAAAAALGKLGLAASADIPQLAALLQDPDPSVRLAAVGALGNMGAAAASVAPQLGALLRDADESVRSAVTQALSKMQAAWAVVSPQVAALLGDTDQGVRSSALHALAAMGPTGAAFAPQVAVLLRDSDANVRAAAAYALGQMVPAGAAFAPQVGALLRDADGEVRKLAVAALGRMGSATAVFAPQIGALLRDPDLGIRANAAGALVGMGPVGTAFAPQIIAQLQDPELNVRNLAAQELGVLGTASPAIVPQVVALLKDPGSDVRLGARVALLKMVSAGGAPVVGAQVVALLADPDYNTRVEALQVLKAMGTAGAAAGPKVATLLESPNVNLRASAADALGNMGSAAAAFGPQVAGLLADPDHVDVRSAAAQALGQMGPAAGAFAPQVAALFGDPDPGARSVAASALGGMGPAGAAFAPQIAALLRDSDGKVRSAAARALGGMGPAGAAFALQVAALLGDSQENARIDAARALGRMGHGGAVAAGQLASLLKGRAPARDAALAVLDDIASSGPLQDRAVLLSCLSAASASQPAALLLHAYLYRTGAEKDLILIRWLGNREADARVSVAGWDRGRALEVLEAFSDVWDETENFQELRKEMAVRSVELARLPVWSWRDATLLGELKQRFADDRLTDQADAMQAVLVKFAWYPRLRKALLLLGTHLSAWLALILAYPRWPWGQSHFFWNKWGRRFFGLGYVGVLITMVPWLRRRMFAPFRASLLPKGIVEQFSEGSYFPDGEVVRETRSGEGKPLPLKKALPGIRGQIVLKGRSGLGKTQLLLRLAALATEPVVFLRATECERGVDAAIEGKLHGQLKDKRYLEALIHAGGLKVLIDGVNEAAPEARVAITQFVKKCFRGDFILTTQPMGKESWEPPSTARVYVLQPLRTEQIGPFLLGQWQNVAGSATLDRDAYEKAVSHYVDGIGKDSLGSATTDVRFIPVSNPMEALLAAELLARGETPDTFRLIEQRYRVMALRFRESQGRDFPMLQFSERVYEWRSSGEPYPSMEGFEAETAALAQDHLMIQRVYVIRMERDEQEVSRWSFRHERIMDFFLLPAFLDEEKSARRYEHAQDERFSGVYELLAVWLPDNEAAKLHGSLMAKAADTNQNDLLNRYALARRARRGPIVHSTPPLALPRALSHEGQPTDQGSPSAAPSGEAATSVESPASPALQE